MPTTTALDSATSPRWHMPRVPRDEEQRWTAAQAATFRRAVAGNPLEAFCALAINTGMRRGEALALHWRDIDLERGTLSIRYTPQDLTGGVFASAGRLPNRPTVY